MRHLGLNISLSTYSKLFWILFSPVFIVSILGSSFLISTRFTDLDRNLFEHSEHMSEQIATTSEYPILFSDQKMMSKMLQDALSHKGISSVQLFDSNKEVLLSLGKVPSTNHSLFPETLRTWVYDDFLVSISPIYYSGHSPNSALGQQTELFSSPHQKNLIGWAKIEANTAEIQVEKYRYASLVIFTLSLFNLLAAIGAWKATKALTRPLNKLSTSLNRLVKGQFSSVKLMTLPPEYSDIQKNLLDLTERLEHHNEELIAGIEQSTEDIRRSMDSMEEKSAQLHIANKEAMESNRLKSQFLANISHEVRTPLNAILGYTKILQKDLKDKQQKLYIDTIEQSTNSLLAIIGDILDFSKIEADKLSLENNHFNLKKLIDDVYQTLSINLLTKEKQIDLVPEFSKNFPEWFIGDSIRVRQILTNLIGNAIKFTYQGSVRTKVSIVNQDRKEIKLAFQIIDTGIGIPEDKMSHLFKPFSQVDTSTTRQFGGTGLGLVITKKLVEQMKGKIEAHSDPAIGSTFRFTISLQPSNKITEAKAPLKRNIIMLEPSQNYKNYLNNYFKEIDVECLSCPDLEQLIVQLNQKHQTIDALLLNISPNEESVSEAQELIVYAKQEFNVPCILMVQPPGQIAQYPDLKDLCHEVLLKPISHERLYNALKNLEEPIKQEANDNKRTTEQKTKTALAGLKILAVDDTPVNLQLLGHWLTPNDLEVTLAYSGMQAIELAKEKQFDLIFMDIQMPEMDGMETTRQLRKLDTYKNIPIIALTAHALGSEQKQILASGMNDYLTKPVDESILLNTIETYCSASENYLDQVDKKLSDIFDMTKALDIVDGKVAIAKEMFELLADSLDAEKKLIRHHLENQDTEKLIQVVHRIHGASKYTGTINVARHAGFLETHLKELGMEEVEGVAEDFIEAIEELLNNRQLISWPHPLDSSTTKA
ncbi:response regulator [Marinomonas transparens]|uniref:histidine kinase n=1 Tax=Marinomonas transparens TaxID=2795388 RepID=A0A934JU52_9GAMM|nr:response regulator [Marinomonas transparens]MBJ7538371.1 response regulator [Marinomonas transparens]